MHHGRRLLLGWTFALLVSVVSATGQDSTPKLQTREEIPFKLVAGFAVLIQGDIGPAHNLNLLLDTGAVPSVLNKRLALQLGVVGPRGQLSLPERDLEAEYVTVHAVRVGPLYSSVLPMVMVNLRSLEQLLNARVDAIIGLDLLREENFTIDYKRKRISLGLSERARNIVQVRIESQDGAPYWVVPITLNGTKREMLLDLGADTLTLFAKHDSAVRDITGSERTAITGIGQQRLQSGPEGVLLLFGDKFFRTRVVILAQESRSALCALDGLLPPKSLGISIIAFDWQHKALLWAAD